MCGDCLPGQEAGWWETAVHSKVAGPYSSDVRTDSRQGRGKVLQQSQGHGQKAASASRDGGIEALTARGPRHPSCPSETCRASWPETAPTPSTGRAGPGVAVWGCALGLWAVPNFLASVRGVVGRLSTRRGHSETLRNRGVQWALVMTPTAKKKKKG